MTAKEKVIFPLGFCLFELDKPPTVLCGKSRRTKQTSYRLKQIKLVFFLFLFCSTTFDDFLTVLARNPKLVKQDKGKSRKKDFENKTEIIKRCPR